MTNTSIWNCSVDILSISDNQASWLSLRIRIVIVHILKLMRNLTGSQCNRLRIRTEQIKRGGPGYHSCKAVLNAFLSSDIFFWHILEKWITIIQLASASATAICLERSKDRLFSNSAQVTDIHVQDIYFFEICFFGKILSNTTPRFLADADGFVSWTRFRHGELLKNFSHWSLVPMRRKSVLLGLSFSLAPVIQADTAIRQCCNFSRDSLALETDRDM